MKGKKIIIAALAAFMLAGCADNTVVEENPASVESSASVAEEIVASSVESKPVESSSDSSSSESKPVESSSASSTESKPEEKPVESSSTTTSTESKPEEKPIESTPTHTHKFSKATCEKPATCECGETKGNALGHNYKDGICTRCGKKDPNYKAPHNCEKDGHVWDKNSICVFCGIKDPSSELSPCEKYGHIEGEWIDEDHCICERCGELHTHDWDITYTTTEPKWCREMHLVDDYGFDVTLAERNFPNLANPSETLCENLAAMGVNGACGSATIDVEVWGTETYWRKDCKTCNLVVSSGNVHTINPIGEWRYINGVNPRWEDPRLNFNTLFYDPYNVPEVTIENINLLNELIWE